MNQSSERAIRFLTSKENIEDVSISDLHKLINESPFFSVAHFLLAKKLKAEKYIEFLPQVQKTVLYFSNPFWLHFQLENEHLQALSDKNVFNIESQIFTKELVASIEKEQNEISTAEISIAEKIKSAEESTNHPEEEMAAITREPDEAAEIFSGEEATANNDDNKQDLLQKDNFSSSEDTAVPKQTAAELNKTDQTHATFLDDTQTIFQENVEQSLNIADNNLFDGNLVKTNKETEEQDEHEKMFQNIKAMLDATSDEADADVTNTAIPIDPYYTIDYFAAQGIKLEFDPNPKDDLGKHLKKFTQWLKQMKKLGPEDATEVISRRETEADIQKIADSSNTVREVVTEAMASVLEKQGKKEKAIELYNKLSFLNPDKSAYFAIKIKNLKGS